MLNHFFGMAVNDKYLRRYRQHRYFPWIPSLSWKFLLVVYLALAGLAIFLVALALDRHRAVDPT